MIGYGLLYYFRHWNHYPMPDVGAEQGTGLQSYRSCVLSPTTYISRCYLGDTMCVVCNICFEVEKCKYGMVMVTNVSRSPHVEITCPINMLLVPGCRRCQG